MYCLLLIVLHIVPSFPLHHSTTLKPHHYISLRLLMHIKELCFDERFMVKYSDLSFLIIIKDSSYLPSFIYETRQLRHADFVLQFIVFNRNKTQLYFNLACIHSHFFHSQVSTDTCPLSFIYETRQFPLILL